MAGYIDSDAIWFKVLGCKTPKLYNGLGRDVEYTLNIPMTFWSSGVAHIKA